MSYYPISLLKNEEFLVLNHCLCLFPSPQSDISEKVQVLEFEHKIHFNDTLSFMIMILHVTEDTRNTKTQTQRFGNRICFLP